MAQCHQNTVRQYVIHTLWAVRATLPGRDDTQGNNRGRTDILSGYRQVLSAFHSHPKNWMLSLLSVYRNSFRFLTYEGQFLIMKNVGNTPTRFVPHFCFYSPMLDSVGKFHCFPSYLRIIQSSVFSDSGINSHPVFN